MSTVVTIGVATVVGAVVLAVSLPITAFAAAVSAVSARRRPERVVLLWDES